MTIPPACFSFTNEQDLLTTKDYKAKTNIYHTLGLVVWSNREDLLKNPPPRDVEDMFEVWILYALQNYDILIMHFDVFDWAFPPKLTREQNRVEIFAKMISE